MKSTSSFLLAAALAATALQARAAEPEVWRFYGYAYELESNRYLYTEVHEQYVDGDRWLKGTIRYYLPDGKLFGRKTLDFANDQVLPLYRMEQYDMGRIEAITDNRENIGMLLRQRTGEPEKTRSMPKPPMTTADSGFHMFIRSQFEKLMAGETVKFQFAAAPEMNTFSFRIRRISDTTFEGQPAVRFKVDPTTLLRFVVDPLELTYHAESKRLLEFRGISNVHDPQGGKAYIVRISYFAKPPEDAPQDLPPLEPPADEGRAE